ncbi:MAG: hypothetical protein ABI307_12135 [Mycobacterium sp.]
MTTATDERQALSQLAEQLGWQRKQRERIDIYDRGLYRVNVMWRDTTVVNGGAYYDDAGLLSYSRDFAKIQSWLAK